MVASGRSCASTRINCRSRSSKSQNEFCTLAHANASVGDCVTFKTANSHHTVMFAGFKNGQPQFIGSNNVNPDGSQKITMGSMNYQLLAVHHFKG